MKKGSTVPPPIPTLCDVLTARKNVYQHLQPTPLYEYPTLSKLLGTSVWIKHENHHPVGAFKIRGGLNLAAKVKATGNNTTLYSASSGNHGMSLSFAARAYGLQVVIAVPEQANPGKVAAMRALGAEVVHHGADFDTAREWIMTVAEKEKGRFVGSTEEDLIAGVGTYGLEIMETLPDVETIIVPVGAGSGICGTSIVAKTINPKIEIIGVQSAQAPAMQKSWQSGTLEPAEMKTTAEGLATRVPFANTQRIMRKYLDDFILVDDTEISAATLLLLEHTHNLVEGAGAASTAAAVKLRARLAGKKVVLVMSGGNLSMEKLRGLVGQA